MTQIPAETPVIIGAGQFTERLESPGYRALSPVDIAAEAARIAVNDAGMTGQESLIDTVMTTRTFEDSTPTLAFPFGRSNNYPRSVAARLGIDPQRAVWASSGGDTPQKLVVEACAAIAAGDARAVLMAGGEALSTGKHLVKTGAEVNWSEEVDGDVDDRGAAIDYVTHDELANGVITPPLFHGLIENARRHEAGASKAEWAARMGALFAPLSEVAAVNPLAAVAARAWTAEELATPGEGNRLIADPYPQRLIARDQVNQSAALVIVASAVADQLGVPETSRVYLHGHAAAAERPVSLRKDIGHAPSAGLALSAALERSGHGLGDIDLFDFYSCFPIAVSNAIEAIGLAANDPRGLTITGGLPYFGGPGNSYSLNALAEMMVRLRHCPGGRGLVAANGGFLSKYAVGIYSTAPVIFREHSDAGLAQQMAAIETPALESAPEGRGVVETYTVDFDRNGQPRCGIIVGRLEQSGARFLARTAQNDTATAAAMLAGEPFGRAVQVSPAATGNNFTFEA